MIKSLCHRAVLPAIPAPGSARYPHQLRAGSGFGVLSVSGLAATIIPDGTGCKIADHR
ncbi:hypothetical protein ACFFJN_18100 [Erwinia mallotivora]|uniref:hypothetical protein n=1 Tax=Erwinia mallotivora TaxID=69222 RepID=UPI0035E6CDAF